MSGFLEKRMLRKSAEKWVALADRTDSMPAEELEHLQRTARRLRRKLDLFVAASEASLIPDGQSEILRPNQFDWAWRPDPWTAPRAPRGVVEVPSPHKLTDHVTLFHDCARSEIVLRQTRNTDPSVCCAFGLLLDVYRFDGSFLSLVLSLPDGATKNISRNHYFSLRARVVSEHPIEIYARLNVQHGPNTEQMVRQLDLSGDVGLAEFDLAYSNINEKRVEKAWIDLIFDNPAMNQVHLTDLTLTRAPRADL
ncbi:DUF6478 family protein [Nioella aestuarii]|uniref:DUF6478 family protein n=1 Tax=Nioella aestuarii TaxID=1662864 RepID=UPI003D7FE653